MNLEGPERKVTLLLLLLLLQYKRLDIAVASLPILFYEALLYIFMENPK